MQHSLFNHPSTILHGLIRTISSFHLSPLSHLRCLSLRATEWVQPPCRPTYVTECLFGPWLTAPADAQDFSSWVREKRFGSVRHFSLQRRNERTRGNCSSDLYYFSFFLSSSSLSTSSTSFYSWTFPGGAAEPCRQTHPIYGWRYAMITPPPAALCPSILIPSALEAATPEVKEQ